MNKKNLALGLAALALVLAIAGLLRPVREVVREVVRELGNSGQVKTSPQFFLSGAFTSGFKDPNETIQLLEGSGAASSTRTLTASEVCDESGIVFEFNTATGTLTLPASVDFVGANCLRFTGDGKDFIILGSQDAGQFEIVAGASSSLQQHALSSSSLAEGYGTTTIVASSTAQLKGFRFVSSTDNWILWQLDIYGKNTD